MQKNTLYQKDYWEIKMEMIKLQNIWKSFGENKVLKKINLEIETGEFITVIGKSGCGKTTMLKIINGLLSPDTGCVLINGENIFTKNIYEVRRSIGYVIQNKGLFPHMIVEKNIVYVPSICGTKKKNSLKKMAEDLIELVGLEKNMLRRYPDELSGGQQQRVGIARALAASPEIILMDEPFSSLDEITKKTMQDVILKLHRDLGLTIIFVTHDIDEAIKLGDRVVVLDKGEIQQIDAPHIIKTKPANTAVKMLVTS